MSTADITPGAIMGLSGGGVARKWLAHCKLNLVDADINAWSCLVNSPELLMITKEQFHLVDSLVELQTGKVAEKERNKEMKSHQKRGKSRLKSLAKDKNSSKSLTLMETVKAGYNGAIE